MQSKVHVSRSNRAFLSPTQENGSGSRLRKARFERETWTYFALLYLHNGKEVKINDLQKSIVTGLLYVHINFEAIWTFLLGATWILNPSGYCAL